jgi:hypothetical protein
MVCIQTGNNSTIYLNYRIKKEIKVAKRSYLYSITGMGTKISGFKYLYQTQDFIDNFLIKQSEKGI